MRSVRGHHPMVLGILCAAAVAASYGWVADAGSVAPPSARNVSLPPVGPSMDSALAHRPMQHAALVAREEASGELLLGGDAVPTSVVDRVAAPATQQALRVRDASTLLAVPGAVSRVEIRPEDGAQILVIEAIGYHAVRLPLCGNHAAVTGQPIDVLLVPVDQPVGITILAQSADGLPVDRLSVAAHLLERTSRSEQTRRSLWARHSHAVAGRHVLPGVPAGEIELSLAAEDGQHRLLPLRTERCTLSFDGCTPVAMAVVLAPAAVPWLEFLRPSGRVFDPECDGPLTLTLATPDGSRTPVRWLQAVGRGTRGAADAVMGIGTAWPSESLPPGTYTLSVWVRSSLRVQRSLQLVAGCVLHERITIP
jgi:hypothetical protein